LQDIEQLTHVYGRADASVILNGGCATRLFYPGLSYSTCQELSNILGNQTVTLRESGFERSNNTSSARDREMARPLLAPDEIRTLKPNRAILIHSNELPVMLNTKPWFKNYKLKKRVRGGGF
jgi:type IV secretory pathway TraG/TraD family ATPase VirD4